MSINSRDIFCASCASWEIHWRDLILSIPPVMVQRDRFSAWLLQKRAPCLVKKWLTWLRIIHITETHITHVFWDSFSTTATNNCALFIRSDYVTMPDLFNWVSKKLCSCYNSIISESTARLTTDWLQNSSFRSGPIGCPLSYIRVSYQ